MDYLPDNLTISRIMECALQVMFKLSFEFQDHPSLETNPATHHHYHEMASAENEGHQMFPVRLSLLYAGILCLIKTDK